MTLEEIQYITEIAGKYDLDFPSQMDEYFDKVYMPVRKAIANNDKTVISFIGQCGKDKRYILFTGVMDGAIEGQHPEAIALYKHLCKEFGAQVDVRISV